jgi:hypothetical protein
VYFEFTPEGRYRGLSYDFASDNSCGFCTSGVASTVTVSDGRLTGTLKGTEAGRPFDITLDVPILGENHGAPLPADGGAPGMAYLAYHAALVKRDLDALKPALSPDRAVVWQIADKRSDIAGFLAYLAEDHPMKAVKIVGGWATADKASLLIEGEGVAGKVSGEVFLVNDNGTWTVDEELAARANGK